MDIELKQFSVRLFRYTSKGKVITAETLDVWIYFLEVHILKKTKKFVKYLTFDIAA